MAPSPLDTPEGKRRLVRALLLVAPFGFVLAYVLAYVQGATPGHAALLGAILAAGCLAAALLFHVAGSNARHAFWAIALIRLFMRR
ncbi:MAG TPA: hypothetical protein VNR51_00675 [Hyphomicrobium sp.]|nr:hypothetical protein [Hyphomicrobium sp.]